MASLSPLDPDLQEILYALGVSLIWNVSYMMLDAIFWFLNLVLFSVAAHLQWYVHI